MAEGKWISGLTATTPLADAARRVLAVRLEVVRDSLPLAVHEADKDPEHVHQLRVGTRRAGAALEIFELCLPAKTHRKAKRTLRKLRRAAGEARDWDVFLLDMAGREPQAAERQRPGLDFLLGYALGQRAAAQDRLVAASPAVPFGFDGLLAETVAAVQDPGHHQPQTLGNLARRHLADLLRELNRAAGQNLDDYDHLHQVRILGKRLRYAMEVFAEAFPLSFKEMIYPQVEEMQEILGQANDSHVAAQRLQGLKKRLQTIRPPLWKWLGPGVEALLRSHQRRLPQQRRQFLKWWERWQKDGSEGTLLSLLHRPVAVS
jgi:CHAD domain-containing protein